MAAKAGSGGDCGGSESEKIMSRKSIIICLCGAISCLSLFVAMTPLGGGVGRWASLLFSPNIILALLIGSGLIITTCVFLVKCNRKKR